MAARTTMKNHVLLPAARALALAAALTACGKQEQAPASPPAEAKPAASTQEVAAPVRVEEKAPSTPPATPAPQEPIADSRFATPSVDLNGFGSNEPVLRADEPTRGVLHIDMKALKRMSAQHWEQFDYTGLTAKRWGRYQVRLSYTLRHTALGTQFRFGQQPLKKTLTASSQPKWAVYGEVYIEKPGSYPFVIFAAASGSEAGFEVHDVVFVPAPEGPAPTQAADGSLVLEAGSATTWSETMRYEPKSVKNCLGFWTNADDLAEWQFKNIKPGRYKVSIFQGCGAGSGGSEVAVKLGGQQLKFTVKDTGGFQNWQEEQIGEIEIKDQGTQSLMIDPLTKAGPAVLDVQKIILRPVG